MEVNIIHASCKGPALNHLYQDFVLVDNCESYMLACVADGVGSCVSSSRGANLICSLLSEMFADPVYVDKLSERFTQMVVDEWYSRLTAKTIDPAACSTTSSFIYIDKKQMKAISGSIGDSPIFIRFEEGPVQMMRASKEFLNETESLGGKHHPQYKTLHFDVTKGFDFLIATDGFGDEVLEERIDGLFEYFKEKYSTIKRDKRNNELKKELLETVQDKNPDDKSIIFGWICQK